MAAGDGRTEGGTDRPTPGGDLEKPLALVGAASMPLRPAELLEEDERARPELDDDADGRGGED